MDIPLNIIVGAASEAILGTDPQVITKHEKMFRNTSPRLCESRHPPSNRRRASSRNLGSIISLSLQSS